MSSPTEYRLALLAGGYTPTPVEGKRAQLDGWTSVPVTPEEIASWAPRLSHCLNSGLLTRPTPTLDNDIMDPEVAEEVDLAARDWFSDCGTIITRFGLAPKRATLFRTDVPFPKKRRLFKAPNGETHKLEFLCDGQQVVVAGIHPDTKQPYRWRDGRGPDTVPRNELPQVTEGDAEEFLDYATLMLKEKFGYELIQQVGNGQGDGHNNGDHAARDSVNVEAELAAIHKGNINDTWLRVLPSMLRHGVAADEAYRRTIEATERAPACQADPKRAWWRASLAAKLTWLLHKDPTFRINLSTDMQVNWHQITNEGGKPMLAWRPDLGKLHVRRDKKQTDTTAEGPPIGDPPKDEAPGTRCRFKLVNFWDLRVGDDPQYLVDELIPRRGLVDLWGKTKCFKSFWAYNLGFHIAMGWEYRDRRVQQGAVVYCAFEGGHGFKKRREALCRHYNLEARTPIPLYLMAGQANLITEHAQLIADIRTQLGNQRPVAVFLDTLNKSLVGSENKDVDMGAYVRAAEAVRDAFDCVVIIVHHCGYDDTRPRGHSSLPAAVDAQLAVTREEFIVTVVVEMMRDGPEGMMDVSELIPIEVGTDKNNKTLTSLVVTPSDAEAITTEHRQWSRGVSVFHAALKSALASKGEPFQPEPGTLPVRAVNQTFVRDRFYATYAEEEEDAQKRQEKIRKAFNRALSDAQKAGIIRTLQQGAGRCMIWLPPRQREEN